MRLLMSSLSVEILKLKRTLAFWISFLLPAVVVALQFLVNFKQADRLAKTPDMWPSMTANVAGLWAVLMLPLFVTLEAALLAQLEHSSKHWKDLFVLPAPRWMFYFSKFLVLAAMVALSTAVTYLYCLGSGNLLRIVRPQLHFGATPWAAAAVVYWKLLSATLLMVAIQHWISLRWKNFTVAVSAGIMAVVIGFIVVNSEYGDYYPWAMPAHAFGGVAGRYKVVLLTSLIAGAAALIAGAWDFTRQELG
jgi:hypothetical protein